MHDPELCLLFIRPLNQLGIRYVASGSIAAIFYGEPRLTHDLDAVVFLKAGDIPKLAQAFAPPQFYFPPNDVIALEAARDQRGHFNAIHMESGFKADFYPAGRDEMNAWAFRGARQLTFRGEPVNVAPPEYVIVRKLEYFREGGSEKHLRDIRAILSASGEKLNLPEMEDWIRRWGLEKEWKQVRTP